MHTHLNWHENRRKYRLLRGSPLETWQNCPSKAPNLWLIGLLGAVLTLFFLNGCALAESHKGQGVPFTGKIAGYTLDQWANAIHRAEGNDNYGILSVKCAKGAECRAVCKRTVYNNYKRWLKAKSGITYLHFLQKRYAPLQAGNDPTGLNGAWGRNVRYALTHPKRSLK